VLVDILSFPDKIDKMSCINFQINNQTTPKFICEECTTELLIVIQFQEKCKRAEQILTDSLNDHDIVKSEYEFFNPVIGSAASMDPNEMIDEDPPDEREEETIDNMIIHEPETMSIASDIDIIVCENTEDDEAVNDDAAIKEEYENFDDIIECEPLSPSMSDSVNIHHHLRS
jgi:hypothetical protein